MNTRQAIVAFSQSEKVKSTLIWATQAVELLSGLPPEEQRGAERLLRFIFDQIANEMGLAHRMTGDNLWTEAEKSMGTARIMLESGVVQESTYHLTQALTRVTSTGQRAMSFLKSETLL